MNKFIKQFQTYNLPNIGWTRLPNPPITKQDREKYGSDDKESHTQFLSRLVQIGFKEKFDKGKIPKDKIEIYQQRCAMELDTFNELHFTGYMLLVWKVIQKAKELGVFIDFGRGSVSGSICAWLLGISGCDPIRYNLFFSRFLNKARAKSKKIEGEIWTDIGLSLDVDINLGSGREELVEWLKDIYPNRISKVSNVSTLTGKILVKDVYKVLENASEDQAKEVSDLVERRFGVVQSIEDIYKGKFDDNGEVLVEKNEDFVKWADNHKDTYKVSLQLRDLIRQSASHASGYLVSFEELTEHTPLCLSFDKETQKYNDCSVYTMDSAQCLKLDLLNLETNMIIKNTLDSISDQIDVEMLNLEDDSLIYDQFQNDNLLPYGLYQISADCAYRVCNHLKPKNVMELSHVNAIARPTALAYEKPYIENKSKCPHPLLENALNWTHFQPLYQEQTLMCLKAIGFDDTEAEMARRVWAKKKTDEVDIQLNKVKEKLKQNNLPKEVGDVVIKLAEEGANYQFNLSHSLSTSYLTALTVYLKYKYPLQFYQACLNEAKNKSDFIERLGQIYKELPSFNITLLPPHITRSALTFTIEGKDLRFSLASIKGINHKSLEKLNKFKNDKYQDKISLFRAADNANLNSSIMAGLILVGSLDDKLKEPRSRILAQWHLWNCLTDNEKNWAVRISPDYKYDVIEIVKVLNERIKNEKLKPVIKDSRRLTIRKNFGPYNKIFEENKKIDQNFLKWYFERALMGFSYSTNLYEIYKDRVDNLVTISEVLGEIEDTKVCFAAEVVEARLGTTKNGNPKMQLQVKDHTNDLRIMVFETNYNKGISKSKEASGRMIKEGDVVIVEGKKKDGNCVFGELVTAQKIDIFLKISQLPKDKIND